MSLQVNAITAAGPGEPSEVVEAETSIERPVPKLLLAKSDSVKVADIDFHEEKLLFSKATHPSAIAYLAEEKRVFVLEEEGALMVSSLDGTNASLVSCNALVIEPFNLYIPHYHLLQFFPKTF